MTQIVAATRPSRPPAAGLALLALIRAWTLMAPNTWKRTKHLASPPARARQIRGSRASGAQEMEHSWKRLVGGEGGPEGREGSLVA